MDHEKFGRKLIECLWEKSQFGIKALFILPAVAILAVFITILTRHLEQAGGDIPTVIVYGVLSVVLSVYIVNMAFFSLKRYDAIVFERGLILKSGSETIEWSFDDLEGILNLDGDFMPMQRRRDLMVITPLSGKGKEITVSKFHPSYPRINMFRKFAKELSNAHTQYLIGKLKGSSPKISFGEQLALDGNALVYTDDKKEQAVIPLDAVRAIDVSDDSSGNVLILCEDFEGDGAIIGIEQTMLMNIDTLFHLLQKENRV